MKKALSAIILAALMLTFASCGNQPSDKSPENTQSSSLNSVTEISETDDSGDKLPDDLDFGGYDFRILIYEGGNTDNSWPCYIDINEENGDILNDAAYIRNLETEERLNVKISCIEKGKFGNVSGEIVSSALSGSDDYDYAVLSSTDNCTSLVTQDILYDINELPYVDLKSDYYFEKASRVFSINGKQFFLSGDFVYPLVSSVYVLFNKDRWTDFGYENPYEIVNDGKWTFDKMQSFAKGAYSDLNGNGKSDYGDFFGINSANVMLIYFYNSFGGKSVELSEEGFTFPIVNEKNISIMENIKSLMHNPDVLLYDPNPWDSIFDGNSLMCIYGSTLNRMRDVEGFEIGLIPMPKFDETQQNYISYIAGGITAVPITIKDSSRTGAVIEALYSSSGKYLTDAFIDKYVEQKTLHDRESQDMYRLILENGEYDFARYIDPSENIFNYKIIENLVYKKSSDLASEWAKVEDSVVTSFQNLYSQISK